MNLSHYTVYEAVFELARIATQIGVPLEMVFASGDAAAIDVALSDKSHHRDEIREIRFGADPNAR